MTKESIRRWWHITRWRLRYALLDTPAGRHVCIAAAVVIAAFGAWQFFAAMRAYAAGEPVQAFWVEVVLFVVSVLISYALTPKQPDAADQVVEAPRVKDGGGVRMVFGEVWITDPDIIGWRKMGTKTIRGKKSGFNGRPIIGYWYKQLFQFLLCRGPVDAVLEFRGGDKTAWKGELTASGEVQINQRELWGGQGTGGEGGIEGPMEFLFGESTQLPSSYLASSLDPKQPAYRGLLTALYKGGLWGAFSPYPKAASFKVRRILEGWERDGGAWYPERALVPLSSSTFARPTSLYIALDTSGSMGGTRLQVLKDGMTLVFDALEARVSGGAPKINLRLVEWATTSSHLDAMPLTAGAFAGLRAFVAGLTAGGGTGATAAYGGVKDFMEASALGNRVVVCISDGAMSDVPTAMGMIGAAVESVGPIAMRGIGIGTVGSLASFDNSGGAVPVVSGDNVQEMAVAILLALSGTSNSYGMSPAHMLYQSITDSWMGAEPDAGINDASFRAAADTLYAEGFGLSTEWDSTAESVEQFQQRICDVIGANLSRSPVDGLWYLDLIRGGYDLSTLPVLTDDDIIEYSEQPGTMQDAVNQVIVEWRDPQRREDRSTAPVQSLGAIQAVGAVVGEVATYREIPEESLALRVAGRNLQSKSRPLRRSSIKTTRIAHAWRPGQVFRLQSAKRGIADMALRIGDADRGTLRSGAIALTVLQDIFGLPQAVYVSPDPSPEPDDDVPKPVAASAVQEVPYALLATLQPTAELAALPADSGYLFAVATPAGGELDYSLQVDAGAGYAEQAESDWSATATSVSAVEKLDTVISITAARGLNDAVIGAMVLWGEEICRLDAVDLIAGTVTLGRGCADTVPAAHAAGERLWVIDDSIALDATQHSKGSAVSVKLLPRAGSMRLQDDVPVSMPILGRLALPYPPGRCSVGGVVYPDAAAVALGEIPVSWAPRDRDAQGTGLIDCMHAPVAHDPATRFVIRVTRGGVPVVSRDDIAGSVATIRPVVSGAYEVEFRSKNENGMSVQSYRALVDFTVNPSSPPPAAPEIVAPQWSPPETVIDAGEIT